MLKEFKNQSEKKNKKMKIYCIKNKCASLKHTDIANSNNICQYKLARKTST